MPDKCNFILTLVKVMKVIRVLVVMMVMTMMMIVTVVITRDHRLPSAAEFRAEP